MYVTVVSPFGGTVTSKWIVRASTFVNGADGSAISQLVQR